ncbi:MAG: phosphatidate cytidylyltransferase [Thermoguttaceae bacterium]|nr:phosphatidate cytidylyltransferase [Thermoguttaceae bacterium]
MDIRSLILIIIVLAMLAIASIVSIYLKRQKENVDKNTMVPFISRLIGWWTLFTILAATLILEPFVGNSLTCILFACLSFWAMREFLTLTPTRPADHFTMFLVLFFCTIVQYVLVAWNLYGLFSIFIPAYAFLLVPACITLSGDPTHFLERAAKIDMGMLICIYSLSFAPAILSIKMPENSNISSIGLLVFFVVIAQISDVLQYVMSLFPIRHYISRNINSSKTWEGIIGSTLVVMIIGAALAWATPFTYLYGALLSFAISVMGAAGSMTLSAVKRDRGVKDYGTLVEGHSGILDRIDSLCFAAPIFYHLSQLILK